MAVLLLHQVAVSLLSMAAGGGAFCRQGAGGMNWAGVGQHLAGGVGGGGEGQEEQELECVVDITEYLNSLCFVTFCMCVCMLAVLLLLGADGCCISCLCGGEEKFVCFLHS